MKKARLADGQVVLAHQYNKEAHAGELLCADPGCTAHMVFRKESLTHGASAVRSAAFVSKAVSDHVANCTAHEDFAIMARQKKSIEQGLKEGKTIVLNLNMNLTDTFNNVARDLVCVASTLEKGNYVTASAKSVEDILDYMKTIEEKGGQPGLDKTVVNYKGKTMPVKDFVIDTKDKYRDLLNKLYTKVDKAGPESDLADFPRLINFKATQNTKKSEKGAIRGTPMTFVKDRGNRIVLLQKADVPAEFEKTLRGENVHVIAIPKLNYGEAKAVLGRLRAQADQVLYLNMHWKVVGAHQFTPVETPEPAVKPKPEPGQQTMFGL
ncbi:MAG: hypothetical protein EPN97_09535 [Alphaproteobacteria bacterium]|nr:MAG: hypothetical protein EPN97_09535 [Alphaproteobacteria bacterium]